MTGYANVFMTIMATGVMSMGHEHLTWVRHSMIMACILAFPFLGQLEGMK